jgi:hypothetical protein
MKNFDNFQTAVIEQFNLMKDYPLYRTEVEKELLWLTYLESFPKGSNPMYKERTEHDCQTCKNFIRAVGSMIAVVDGGLVSLWDCKVNFPYNVVAKELSNLVKDAPIRNVFLHEQTKIGNLVNYNIENDAVIEWRHFFLRLPTRYVSYNRGRVYGERKTTRDVFYRALTEIRTDAIETVVELIEQNSLYRGEENLNTVRSLLQEKNAFDQITSPQQQDIFCWKQDLPIAVTRIRNSAIGTLLVDLSNGEEINSAVRSFETKVAPQNYKRPSAIVTKAMIERAKQTVNNLGYGTALDRRFAVAEDITINNVLFANRDARNVMGEDVFDEMINEVKVDKKNFDKVEEIDVQTFVDTIIPKAHSIELLFENRHAGNLVNLVAPKDPEARNLFKWNNNFSWSYNGDVTDSIKERVKQRGGSVTGDFRASLSWFNLDDLDIHLIEPNGNKIYFGERKSRHSLGKLDVDMNVPSSGDNSSRNAVENITYPHRNKMMEGEYHLFVHNYTHRERIDVGFEVEVEFDNEIYKFAYDEEVQYKQKVTVAKFVYSHSEGIHFITSLPKQDISRELWNLQTETFHPVTMIMYSPNYWDEKKVGNRHYFFTLQNCLRDGSSRGFFNEYLSDDLREHRKVFEILGSKMRTEQAGAQLSGLGFSSTKRNSFLCKVTGSFTRTVRITF